ncbi:MAG: hypothetical protein JSW00_09235 [Thermoplasmata archaeon]|nr:MAG: hypothetical protein JSW00_09235 [Thermoplasmata archaeon]
MGTADLRRKIKSILICLLLIGALFIALDESFEVALRVEGEDWSDGMRLSEWGNGSVEPSIVSYENNVHVVWADNKTGNFEIYYRRSLDNGATWESEMRLTYTSENQTNPRIAVWENNVHVVWNKGYVNSTDNGVSWGIPFNPFPAENITAVPDVCIYQDNVYFVVANYTYHWIVQPSSGTYWTYVLFKELTWPDWVIIEYDNGSFMDMFVPEVAMALKNQEIHIIYGLTWKSFIRQIYHSYSLSAGVPGSWSSPELVVDGLEKLGISMAFDQDLLRIAWSEWVGDSANNISMGTNTKSWNGTWSDHEYVGGAYGMTAVSGYYITWGEADYGDLGSNIDGIILVSSGHPYFNWHDVYLENDTVHLVYIDAWEIYYMQKNATEPPSPPTNLNAFVEGNNIKLSWNASSDDGFGNDDVLGYTVYKSSTGVSGNYEFTDWILATDSASYSWIDSGAGDGDINDYFYIVRANDTTNNEEQNTNKVGKMVNSLGRGWNMISVPLIQSNSSAEHVLQTLQLNYATIQGYHAGKSRPWLHWHRDKPNYFNDEIEITHEWGYYIDMVNPDYLVVAGKVPASTQISLKVGWNLVGYPSPIIRTRDDALSSISGSYNKVEFFDTSKGKEVAVESLDDMNPNLGYWIHVTDDCVWDVP